MKSSARTLSDEALDRHTNIVISVAFSPNSKAAATGSSDGNVRIWDVGSQSLRATIDVAGPNEISQVMFLPDGESIAVYGQRNFQGVMLCTADGKVSSLPLPDSCSSVWLHAGKALLLDENGTLSLVDLGRPRQRSELPGTFPRLRSASLSSDGAWFAVADDDVISLIGTQNGVQRWCIPISSDWPSARLVFSPDGLLLACANAGERPFVVETLTGRVVATLGSERHQYVGRGPWYHQLAAFSTDGRLLATSGNDGIVCLWEMPAGKLIRKLTSPGLFTQQLDPETALSDPRPAAHQGYVRDICFSPDGVILASAGDDHVVRLWNFRSGAEIGRLGKLRNQVRRVAISDDSHRIVAGYEDGSLKVWEPDNARPAAISCAYSSPVAAMALSASHLVSASGDGTLRVWDPLQLRCQNTFQFPEGSAKLLAIGANDDSIICGGSRMEEGASVGNVTILDLETGHERARFRGWGDVPIRTCGGWWSVNAMALSPNGELLATAVNDEIQLWDIRSEEITARFRPGEDSSWDVVTCLTFSPDGATIAGGTVGMTIVLRDVMTGVVRQLRVPRDGIKSMAFSPDGRILVASTSYWHAVWLLNVISGEVIGSLEEHTNVVNCVAFSGDGASIVTGGADGEIRIWRDDWLQMTGASAGE